MCLGMLAWLGDRLLWTFGISRDHIKYNCMAEAKVL